MRQGEALAISAAGKQQGAHARGLADANRRYVTVDELHRVIDRQPCRDRPTRRIDVKVDVLVGVLRLEEQELCHDQVGHVILDRTDDEYDPLLEQSRVDVIGPLASSRLFYDDRDEIQCGCAHVSSVPVVGEIFATKSLTNSCIP